MFLICSENYKRIKISEDGCTDQDYRYPISALKRNGELIKKDFIGFIDRATLFRAQLVKLVNIVGIYNNTELIDVPKGYWVLGVYHRHAFSVVLENNNPIYCPINHEGDVKRYYDNVISLDSYDKK